MYKIISIIPFAHNKFAMSIQSEAAISFDKDREIAILLSMFASRNQSEVVRQVQNQSVQSTTLEATDLPPPTKFLRRNKSCNKPPAGPAPLALESSEKIGTIDIESISSYDQILYYLMLADGGTTKD